MKKAFRYYGNFCSLEGVRFDFEIWVEQKNDLILPERTKVTLSADAIQITWNEVDKLDPVHGSSATVSLVSMSDREFIDMYTVETGTVQLYVFRNNDPIPYWSGTLDPEIFEEPYSYKDRYITVLTFVDFGILERKNWDGNGFFSVRSVIRKALEVAQLDNSERFGEMDIRISTSTEEGSDPLSLDEVFVLGQNFYDEDGEAMNMRDVLEGVLRPFALKIVQKHGFHIFDLNAIYGDSASPVEWRGVDASISADKVYNDVTVTFSPYGTSEVIEGNIPYEDVTIEGKTRRSVYLDYKTNDRVPGFQLYYGSQDNLPLRLSNGAQFFRIVPEYSGNNEAGVIWAFRDRIWSDEMVVNSSFPQVAPPGYGSTLIGGSVPPEPIMSISSEYFTRREDYLGDRGGEPMFPLRINLDVLFDVRYNPFEEAGDNNEGGNWKNFNRYCNFGYIPVMLYLKDQDGNILYHYENVEMVKSSTYIAQGNEPFTGWVKGPGKWEDMWLAYYSFSDRKKSTGFGGWKTNNQVIGRYTGSLPRLWDKRDAGEYVAQPPQNGYLELQIGSGLFLRKSNESGTDLIASDLYKMARWLMYKNPRITIGYEKGSETSDAYDDIVDTAWINRSAKEELPISTIVGTAPNQMSNARGLIFDAAGVQYMKFSRAGITDRLERLLIGTVYSQYATRSHMLSGTVKLLPEFQVRTDNAEPGQYIVVNESQRLADDESEIQMVQFSADSYEGIEYK